MFQTEWVHSPVNPRTACGLDSFDQISHALGGNSSEAERHAGVNLGDEIRF